MTVTFESTLGQLRDAFRTLPDHRQGEEYDLYEQRHRCWCVQEFFMQAPSFLAHQRDLQIRNLLDPIAPEHLRALYWALYTALQAHGHSATIRSGGKEAWVQGAGQEWAATIIVPAPVGELSVMYNRYLGQWIMFYFDQMKQVIMLRDAQRLTGPCLHHKLSTRVATSMAAICIPAWSSMTVNMSTSRYPGGQPTRLT